MRSYILKILFQLSQGIYRYFKTNKPWNYTRSDLLNFPKGTIGAELGLFLRKNNFDLLAKAERHDIYHILTGFDTIVVDEIRLAFYMFGNGKRSLYLLGVASLGFITHPDQWKRFRIAYKEGKKALPFHDLAYHKLLYVNLTDHQKKYSIKTISNL